MPDFAARTRRPRCTGLRAPTTSTTRSSWPRWGSGSARSAWWWRSSRSRAGGRRPPSGSAEERLHRSEVDRARELHVAVAESDVTILSCKHVNMNDPLHLVALTSRVAVFGPFAGSTVIPSKRPLFDLRIRRWIDDLGAIPTYRRKDFAAADGTLDDEATAALAAANARLVEVCANLMRRGKNIAIFPESERSAKIEGSEPSRVNPLKDGVARMYLSASGAKKLPCNPVSVSTGTNTSATMNVAYTTAVRTSSEASRMTTNVERGLPAI